MSLRILIIDDEPAITRVLQPVLSATGASVFSASSGVEGLRMAKDSAVDVVLLDLGLPDIEGKELIPDLKAIGQTAIIVVSARHQEAEKVAALDAGADDYVDKPFNIDELMARIRASQRKLGAPASGVREVGDLRVDLKRRLVHLMGEEIKLSPKEYELLRVLTENAGQVVTHRRLLLAGWGDPAPDNQYLRSYIALLRQKLEEDPAEPSLIITEPGVGYRLASRVAVSTPHPKPVP